MLFTCHTVSLWLYTQHHTEGAGHLLLLTTPLYHFQRHSNPNQCFKWPLGLKSLRYLRRMSGLYWECARLNTTSWWMDLPIIFFHRSLTPPLLGDCWLRWIGAHAEHFPGLWRQWVWSELSVHVTADSFAVKSLHCEWPPQEATQNEGEKVSARKECVTFLIYRLWNKNPHQTTHMTWGLHDDYGNKRFSAGLWSALLCTHTLELRRCFSLQVQ